MSGVHRFLSRRDKKNHPVKRSNRSDPFGGIFTLEESSRKKIDKEDERKVKGILARLHSHGVENITESNVDYALRMATPQGDPEDAYRLLVLLEDTFEGIVRPFDPRTKLLGAVNRESVSCFLDALLFAMFARLDSFEAMLYDSFEDRERRKLAGLLRLWVNMLRTGRLITPDITKHVQQALADCGWAEAARIKQQDPSEAFSFITGKLELPLLTLKMDLYHTGKEDLQDDHKFINERLLEVAILDKPSEGHDVVTLEDCLEHYFNNRIEVKRHLENQRRNTLVDNAIDEKRGLGLHVEVADLGEASDTPLVQTPVAETPSTRQVMADKFRPSLARKRADSIFSQRKIEIIGIDPNKVAPSTDTRDVKERKMSTRTEVLMPAWQFFKLLPWYTDHMPTSDAQVAAHFSKKRPVLGICLKRYSYTNTGQAQRLKTYVDIPLEIVVPNFVSDDSMESEGPLVGNFTLLLQSVVCHRGVSVHSGHYICLSRGMAANARRSLTSDDRLDSDSDSDMDDPWMRFDDLATDRVKYVDIHQALKEETPYLLFYQVQPIGGEAAWGHDLPTYAEATSNSHSDPLLPEKYISSAWTPLTETSSEPTASEKISTGATDPASTSARTSLDANSNAEGPRGRSSVSKDRDERRGSITIGQASRNDSTSGGSVPTDAATSSIPPTPTEEKGNSLLSVLGSRRGSRQAKSRSRPASNGPDGNASRFSLSMSRLSARMGMNDAQFAQPLDAVAADLTGQLSVSDTEKTPATISISPLPDTDIQPVKPDRRSKERKREKEKMSKAEKRMAKGMTRDDRDCTIM